jgi:hypothetical protein
MVTSPVRFSTSFVYHRKSHDSTATWGHRGTRQLPRSKCLEGKRRPDVLGKYEAHFLTTIRRQRNFLDRKPFGRPSRSKARLTRQDQLSKTISYPTPWHPRAWSRSSQIQHPHSDEILRRNPSALSMALSAKFLAALVALITHNRSYQAT